MKRVLTAIRYVRSWCTIGDLALIGIIWLAAGISTGLFFAWSESAAEVRVEVGGRLVGVYDPAETREVTVDGAVGPVTLAIGDGGVSVEQADCPLQICTRTGRITRTGMVIACVPNRLVVYLTGPPDPDERLITQ